ncbi:uncharacterized protein EURHEDRAFT_412784 [Aspergillus ruber CBS 135680]|uniref:Uncharacterized protein n=1 Tax=Aspergillus ruber (strain CBS 135680) TaxID=1388766 RepID=A0A017SD26_ASPRC|nr:uncharacterized protein EURHEDRAFT_412784 [Aspergillus ruber CBS 135680]EYE94933.1 hypothetical protein EURHEDRAFT_412784 [Aspergillus ruber CBS 135680]
MPERKLPLSDEALGLAADGGASVTVCDAVCNSSSMPWNAGVWFLTVSYGNISIYSISAFVAMAYMANLYLCSSIQVEVFVVRIFLLATCLP